MSQDCFGIFVLTEVRWCYDDDVGVFKDIQSPFVLSLLRISTVSRLARQISFRFSFSLRLPIVTMPALTSRASDLNIEHKRIFINNEWHKASNGKRFAVINPSTGDLICQVEEGTKV